MPKFGAELEHSFTTRQERKLSKTETKEHFSLARLVWLQRMKPQLKLVLRYQRSHTHPLLLPPVVAQLVIQPPSRRGPLRRHPAYAPLHEAQRLLPGAHLLQQGPDVGPESSLDDGRR